MSLRRVLLKRRISVAKSNDGRMIFMYNGKITKKNQDDIKTLMIEIANGLKKTS